MASKTMVVKATEGFTEGRFDWRLKNGLNSASGEGHSWQSSVRAAP